jgi:hypothetical protein
MNGDHGQRQLAQVASRHGRGESLFERRPLFDCGRMVRLFCAGLDAVAIGLRRDIPQDHHHAVHTVRLDAHFDVPALVIVMTIHGRSRTQSSTHEQGEMVRDLLRPDLAQGRADQLARFVGNAEALAAQVAYDDAVAPDHEGQVGQGLDQRIADIAHCSSVRVEIGVMSRAARANDCD